jgi:hypothetical protein
MSHVNLPKNRDYKQSSYWYPKKVKRTVIPADIAPPTLAERLKTEDMKFDRLWNKYWKQRGKWDSFEDFVKQAA